MNDVGVIDLFLEVFSRYIDSGFGLLHGDVAFLTAALVTLDMTLAGAFWALSSAAGGGGDDVLSRLIKKVLYVGSFAYIIGNFNWLAGILFRSFAGLGLIASGSTVSQEQFLQPGRLAKVGLDAAQPIMQQIGQLMGFPEVFANLDVLVVLFLAWAVLIVSFFVLAIQLFVTLIEFKLTTLAGFVLVPFALWNKTSFLAEKVLGNVVASGIKVLVLAVIVGIGTGLFVQFVTPPGNAPSIDHALVIMLASMAMLGLGIFGPGIATGLVSGAPQLGAGAAVGTASAVAGMAMAAGAMVTGAGASLMQGARMAPNAARSAIGGGASAARGMNAMAKGAAAAYRVGAAASAGGPARAVGAGLAQVAKASAGAVGRGAAAGVRKAAGKVTQFVAEAAAPRDSKAPTTPEAGKDAGAGANPPAWAQKAHRQQRMSRGASAAAEALRSAHHGGGGSGPDLRDDSNP